MCDDCLEVDRLLEEATATVKPVADRLQKRKNAGGKVSPLGEDGIPSLFAMALMKRAMLQMVEEGVAPENIVKAVMWQMEPLLNASGFKSEMVLVDPESPEGKKLSAALEKAKDAEPELQRERALGAADDDLPKGETWH